MTHPIRKLHRPRHHHLVCFALLLAPLFAACRDPEVGPPPKTLDAEQRRRVQRRTFGPTSLPTPRFQPPGGAVTLGGGAIRYLGADVVPVPVVRGAAVTVTHIWSSLKPLHSDQKVFVHVSAGASGIVVNGDHRPVEGLWPTHRWEVGKSYEDPHTFILPEHFSAASMLLSVGLFRFDRRLPVDRRGAHDGANRISLPPIPVQGGAAPLPEYLAPRALTPPTIDGRLDDLAWRAASRVGLVRSDGRGAPRFATWARLLWDDTRIYVAFEVEDPDLFSTFEADDDPLYEQEVVEIFLDADGDGGTYNELQVAPSGRRFDASFVARRSGMDLGWSSKMEIGLTRDGTLNDDDDLDGGWTVELAIPVATLSAVPRWPPRSSDVWRFNLYRLEHPGRSAEEGSAFSPPGVPDFHHLPRFARLRFGGSAAP